MPNPIDLLAPGRLRVGINPAAGSDSQLRSVNNLVNVAGEGDVAEAWLTNYSNTPGGFNLRLAQSRGTAAVPLTVQNGDYIFELEAFAYNGTSFTEGAEIKVVVDGACVAGQAVPTRMEFWTNVVNALPTLKAFIGANGNFVINNTSAILHNNGGTPSTSNLTLQASATTGSSSGAYLKLYGTSNSGGAIDLVCGSTGTFTLFSAGAASITVPSTGIITFTQAPIFTAATATTILAVNGSKQLVSYTLSGTGTVVPLTASPTFTGTVGAAAITMTGQLKINTASALISNGTTDGSDNGTLELNGGGGSGTSRGSKILLSGNEAGAFGDIDLDTGVGGWINLSTNGTLLTRWVDTGGMSLLSNIATTVGGNTNGIKFGVSDVCGIFFGSGAPTIAAPQGSFYFRTDGGSTITRAYINTNNGTTWTAIVTVA